MAVRMRTTQDYKSLQAKLLEARATFEDPQFPTNMRSLFSNGTIPQDLRRHIKQVEWKRPIELVPNPMFIVEDANRHDMDQGLLGDCWFIAGAALLATAHRPHFDNVVPSDQGFEEDRYTGLFRFNFWWYGEWVEVIIDDRLPTDGQNLIFARNNESKNEFWPCLLEKAYAKLNGNYEALVGGFLKDALVDMTGGISEFIDIRHKNEVLPELYSLLYTSFKMKSFMGAGINKEKDTPPSKTKMSNGLVKGHAYSITKLAQIPTSKGNVNLLRLRNPWSKGEWNGPWSDSSREMESLPEEWKKQLTIKDTKDGEFWMAYEDFIMNFSNIQFCHLQPDAFVAELEDNDKRQMWHVTIYHDDWLTGVTAGGRYENSDLFWKNPQFFITLKSPDNVLGHGDDCTLIVSLMKKEKKRMLDIFIQYYVFKLKNPDLRPLDACRASKNALLVTPHSDTGLREVTQRLKLQPGTYVIIPCTYNPHEEAKFLLRLFTEKQIDSGVLDEEPVDTPQVSYPKKYLAETFERHAGRDKKLDAVELSAFLQDILMTEFGDVLKFPVESCRSLVTLMDENKSGFLGYSETKRAWKQIRAYRDVFKQFDSDNANTVKTYDLAKMFSRLGFRIGRAVLTVIVRRYGGRNNQISLPDFIMINCKLTSLCASFTEQKRKSGHDDGLATFKRKEFLEVTMFI